MSPSRNRVLLSQTGDEPDNVDGLTTAHDVGGHLRWRMSPIPPA